MTVLRSSPPLHLCVVDGVFSTFEYIELVECLEDKTFLRSIMHWSENVVEWSSTCEPDATLLRVRRGFITAASLVIDKQCGTLGVRQKFGRLSALGSPCIWGHWAGTIQRPRLVRSTAQGRTTAIRLVLRLPPSGPLPRRYQKSTSGEGLEHWR